MTNEITILGNLIITPLIESKKTFDDVMSMEHSVILDDARIKRFEYTYEMAWKTLKRVLQYRGIDTTSPRETFRAAAKEGLIADPTRWFHYIELRNMTVHTYDKTKAHDVVDDLPDFQKDMTALIETLLAL